MADPAVMTAETGGNGTFVPTFLREFTAGLKHHILLFAGGGAVFVAGYLLSLASGHMLAASPLGFAVSYVGVASIFVGLAIVAWKFLRMALVEKPERPMQEFARWLRHDILHARRLANGANGMIFVFLLMGGFTMAKNTVSRFGGFRWDEHLAALDKALHGGAYPHEWLQPLLGHPWITFVIDQNYVLWFPVLFASCFVASFLMDRSAARHRFLLALCFAWGLGGILGAVTFASAGPVYYARVTSAAVDPYAPHFAYLRDVSAHFGLKALAIQDKLWATYTGETPVSLISAMPSMHSAITMLVCFACWPMTGWLRATATIFTVLILLGSVHLGWHYAADAYAGILVALFAWFAAGRITAWHMRA